MSEFFMHLLPKLSMVDILTMETHHAVVRCITWYISNYEKSRVFFCLLPAGELTTERGDGS